MCVGAVLRNKSLLKWLNLTMSIQQDMQLNTYLYFWKKFGSSNSLDQSALFCNISSVIARPVRSLTIEMWVKQKEYRRNISVFSA